MSTFESSGEDYSGLEKKREREQDSPVYGCTKIAIVSTERKERKEREREEGEEKEKERRKTDRV